MFLYRGYIFGNDWKSKMAATTGFLNLYENAHLETFNFDWTPIDNGSFCIIAWFYID